MASSAQITIGDTPTILYQSNGPQVETVMIDNAGPATITLGGPGVVASEGPQLAQSSTPITLTINEDILYAICPSGQTATVQLASWISGPNT
jgi:hypothetical protein